MYTACHRIFGDEVFAEGARQIRAVLASGEDSSAAETWSGFTGSSSDIYALSLADGISLRLERQTAGERIRRLLNRRSLLAGTARPDLVGGLSGALLALVAAGENDRFTVDGDLIHALYIRVGRAAGIAQSPTRDLGELGMAHGRAGVCFAAARTAHYLGEENAAEYWTAQLLRTGQDLLHAAQSAGDYGAVSWCRGTAGLTAALVHSEEASQETYPLTDLTLNWLFENSHLAAGRGLCCGIGSLADIMATLGANPRRREHFTDLERASLLRTWVAEPQNPRMPHGANHLGFMQGTAGFVYTLLRLTSKGRDLPSPLALDSFEPSRAG